MWTARIPLQLLLFADVRAQQKTYSC